MTLDPTILSSDQYLELAAADDHTDRLERTLAAALSRCRSYTRRSLEPIVTPAPGLPLPGGGAHGLDVSVVRAQPTRSLVRVPDCRELLGIDVLDGPYAGTIGVEDVELVRRGSAPTAPWIRLPFRPVERPRIVLTGKFGMVDLPPDLEDSLYTYASVRWRERDAMFGERVSLDEGGDISFPRRLPTVVRGVWDEYALPKAAVGSIQIVTGR